MQADAAEPIFPAAFTFDAASTGQMSTPTLVSHCYLTLCVTQEVNAL